jgi:hypothetical protein
MAHNNRDTLIYFRKMGKSLRALQRVDEAAVTARLGTNATDEEVAIACAEYNMKMQKVRTPPTRYAAALKWVAQLCARWAEKHRYTPLTAKRLIDGDRVFMEQTIAAVMKHGTSPLVAVK